MTEQVLPAPLRRSLVRPRVAVAAAAAWTLLLGNAAAIVWLWWHGGNVTDVHDSGELLTSLARITGLLGAYSALVQVLLLARIPELERLVGFDRLTIWHRWNGHACLYLILAHVAFSFYGYALMDGVSLPSEVETMIGGGIYPGMVTATVGTVLFVVVVLSSIVIARRRLPYEWWYAVHLTSYAAIALAWFHQVPTGNELVLDRSAADYWAGLYLATLGVLVAFRLLRPAIAAVRFRLRVSEVVDEGRGVVSLRIEGRGPGAARRPRGAVLPLALPCARRVVALTPFSLSAAPERDALRITVKALGDFTARIGRIPVGTRVIAEGPFGVFTAARQSREKLLLIGGGIGITPIRAMLDDLHGDVVVLYRVLSEDDAILLGELPAETIVVAGDHASPEGRALLAPAHLRELVPDVAEREVFVCGPPAMAEAAARNARCRGRPPVTSTSSASPSERRTSHAQGRHRRSLGARSEPALRRRRRRGDEGDQQAEGQGREDDHDQDRRRACSHRRPVGHRPGHGRRPADEDRHEDHRRLEDDDHHEGRQQDHRREEHLLGAHRPLAIHHGRGAAAAEAGGPPGAECERAAGRPRDRHERGVRPVAAGGDLAAVLISPGG